MISYSKNNVVSVHTLRRLECRYFTFPRPSWLRVKVFWILKVFFDIRNKKFPCSDFDANTLIDSMSEDPVKKNIDTTNVE